MYELKLTCPQAAVASVTEALQALDALSVSSADADQGSAQEQPLFGEPGEPPPPEGWLRTAVSALFSDEAAARDAAALLQPQDFFQGARIDAIAPMAERDWVRLTQAQFDAVAITPDFWIAPSWRQAPAGARHVIQLDPGLAFGTGTHPTTRMCLQWIAAHPPTRQRVLDYGCGSGILAIAAALFGAGTVDAVDIDPQAVAAAAENAASNHVSLRTGLPELAAGSYATILANILAQPLKVLAPLLCGHLAPGGHLVLAGILERQIGELQAAYRPWLALEVSAMQEGWVLLTGAHG